MLVCRDLLWVGTSAGVVLTIPTPHLTPTSSRLSSPPPVTGNPSRNYAETTEIREFEKKRRNK